MAAEGLTVVIGSWYDVRIDEAFNLQANLKTGPRAKDSGSLVFGGDRKR